MSFIKKPISVVVSLLIVLSPAWAMEENLFDGHRAAVKGQYKNEGLFDGHRTIALGPDDFQDQAKKMFPDKTKIYTYSELEIIFNPIMHLEVAKIFQDYFTIMYDPEFGKPLHSNKKIIKGYRCLYKKIAYAQTFKDAEEQKESQKEAIYQLLSFPSHKKGITSFNAELGNQILGFPCESCAKTAYVDFGIKTRDVYDLRK